MDKTAIVILNWNGKGMLRKYLADVVKYSVDDNTVVYVADNASTDDSVNMLHSDYPEVKVIELERNWGFAEGYNKALEKVKAEYYVLLNSDVRVTQNWLRPMTDFLDTHPEAAACQPKLLAMADNKAFEYAGACGGFIDRFGYPFCRGRIFDTVEQDNGQYDTTIPILWATGACMMIRSTDYWKVGGLDSKFFAHNEEIDLCWQLRTLGRKIYCIPSSKVYHVGGGTLPKGNPMKTYLNFRNNLTMLYKNLPAKELDRVMRARWFLDYLAALQMLVIGRSWGDFKAVFRARKDFRKWKPDFAEKRMKIRNNARLNDIPERVNKSILWDYYAKGRKTFAEVMK